MRILTVIRRKNPKVLFLLENVLMQKKWESILSGAIGVDPIMIDSTLVSAQTRKRLYWTNIHGVVQPTDKGILLKDILETNDYPNKATILGRRLNADGKRKDYNKEISIFLGISFLFSNKVSKSCFLIVLVGFKDVIGS